ncbi:transcriptional regulator, LacI family [Natronincola peptidivorans]|uniref:Transcriptional regulator, LacI family n=1 Tax=Natronincola peptidivorans TaxID=426128 RepID=A0A1I0G8Y4_9FIRM|nr:substrate-binding domain-containing protein [Natronincola peptidivorans]SET66423.1 transcriptional regulator, LacI family [Natronincola peptidivorans]
MSKIKLKDVAEKAGVSKSTVSQFINKRYEFMGKDTREKIEKIIEELGYQPNEVARSLKIKKTHTIGVIVANILHPFSTYFSRGVEDYCQQHGYNVILCNADNDPFKEQSYIKMLQMKQADGIIIASTGKNNDLIMKEIERGFPIVLFDRHFKDFEADTVLSDNYQGAFEVVEHLIHQGHRKIGLVIPEGQLLSMRKLRIQGYYDALKKHDIPVEDAFIKFVSKHTALLQLDSLCNGKNKPTAIFTINDLVTIEVLNYLKQNKIKIPEDLAMVAFDDLPMASLLEPPLTVVAQPNYEMGTAAATLLVNRIESKNIGNYVKKVIPCKLIIRESCGLDHSKEQETASNA